MEKIVSLAKRRGFIFPGSEIYGGLSNSYDYGPLGVELKNNIARLWWKKFVQQRDDMVGLDAAIIMNPKVWEASGHVAGFSDPLVECKKCHARYRVDNLSIDYRDLNVVQKEFNNLIQKILKVDFDPNNKSFNELNESFDGVLKGAKTLSDDERNSLARILEKILEEMKKKRDLMKDSIERAGFIKKSLEDSKKYIGQVVQTYLNRFVSCPKCEAFDWEIPKQFNLMLKTFLGPAEEQSNIAYFRPEIAQAMFVNFKQVLDTTRRRLPFGIASQGKAFRNEITPGNFIFRTREFNLMEFEYFVRENEWEKWFGYWQNEMREWLKELGIDLNHIHEIEIPEGDRAHYSKRTVDFEYDYPFGQKELYGLAYRTDFDLKNHEKFSGQNLKYRDPDTGEEFWPHVIEPTFGLDRSVLVTLLEAYHEDDDRTVLKLPMKLAPYKAAVFPLLANKLELVKLARKIYDDLRENPPAGGMVAWDDRGNIGKRYYAQDEIGTPFCVTVDFDTLGEGKDVSLKDTVTVRDRDTMKQERVSIEKLREYLETKILNSKL